MKTDVYKNIFIYIYCWDKYSLFNWLIKIKFVNNINILNLIFLYLFYKQYEFYKIFLKFKKYFYLKFSYWKKNIIVNLKKLN